VSEPLHPRRHARWALRGVDQTAFRPKVEIVRSLRRQGLKDDECHAPPDVTPLGRQVDRHAAEDSGSERILVRVASASRSHTEMIMCGVCGARRTSMGPAPVSTKGEPESVPRRRGHRVVRRRWLKPKRLGKCLSSESDRLQDTHLHNQAIEPPRCSRSRCQRRPQVTSIGALTLKRRGVDEIDSTDTVEVSQSLPTWRKRWHAGRKRVDRRRRCVRRPRGDSDSSVDRAAR